jgi:chloride channel protein, CIC family
VKWAIPHWTKLTVGGALTGVCGLLFVLIYPGLLVPLGPNYEAVGAILDTPHSASELVLFGLLKLCATICSLASGGVSAMFAPLFLTGGAFGTAFAQWVVHSPALELYAAVGMTSFIAGGYKTPLAAVVFVAEATGGHAVIIPALIGSAVAFGVSGDASVSGDQNVHEGVRIHEPQNIKVSGIMQRQVVCVLRSLNLREFADVIALPPEHTNFPVADDHHIIGTHSTSSRTRIAAAKWTDTTAADVADRTTVQVAPDCDAMEALRLRRDPSKQMLLVASGDNKLQGIVTKADILKVLELEAIGN